MNVLELSRKILQKYTLCDYCLGRQFSNLTTGTTNKQRGEAIKLVLAMNASTNKNQIEVETLQNIARTGSVLAKKTLKKNEIEPEKTEKCFLCQNKIEKVEKIAEEIIKKIEKYEFESFLVGSIVEDEVFQKENKVKDEFNLHGSEYLKQEFNREIGKIIAQKMNKTTDFNRPDIIIECEPFSEQIVNIKIRSLYIYGRYNKFIRTIPQTHWDCRNCKGKGCEKCNFTGKNYPESVEELMAETALNYTKGEQAVLHGSGREDIDVRMLGTGRPFVLEIKKPKVRTIDLQALEEEINEKAKEKIKVNELRFSTKKEVIRLKTKSQHATKKYRAKVEFEKEITDEEIKNIEQKLKNKIINQKTPERVKHRRADIIRKKTINEVRCKRIDEKRIEAWITCEGGTYIKELISGDNERTKPSFTEIAKKRALCIELDVIEVNE